MPLQEVRRDRPMAAFFMILFSASALRLFNHNSPPCKAPLVSERVQLLKQCGQILRTRQVLSCAPYLCLKMMSSIKPYSFDCCAFMMKSRSTSRSTFSRRWPVCFDSNWLVISRMRRISRA